MSRHNTSHYDRPPTLHDLMDAFGVGWAVGLLKGVVWLGLVTGGVWLRYYLATAALTDAFQHLAPVPVQQQEDTANP